MLASVGKLASIGEMLTMSDAASQEPGERQTNIFDSLVVWVHLAGAVHDIPCWSHFIVWPPAKACVWAAVGVACSTLPSASPEVDVDLPGPPELVAVLSLLLRLQNERANLRTRRTGICFMGHTHKEGAERAVRFYSKTGFQVNCLRYKSRRRV